MDFWRRSARISRKDKIRNNIIKQKMNATRSLLDDIKTKQPNNYTVSATFRYAEGSTDGLTGTRCCNYSYMCF